MPIFLLVQTTCLKWIEFCILSLLLDVGNPQLLRTAVEVYQIVALKIAQVHLPYGVQHRGIKQVSTNIP